MRKTIISIIIVLIMLFGGCQIAEKANAVPETPTDTFCGFFITLKPIGESTEVTALLDGCETVQEALMAATEPRIYGEYHEDADGIAFYEFEDIEGLSFICLSELIDNSEGYMLKMIGDKSLQVDGIRDSSTDVSDEILITATMFFDVHSTCQIYTNPVYQSADGRVYCTTGRGYCYSTANKQPGEWGSTSMAQCISIDINGKKKNRTVKAVLNLAGVNTIKQIVVKQINGHDELIAQAVITQDSIPDSITVLPETSYIVTEEHSVDSHGKESVERTVLSSDKEPYLVRFTADNGLIEWTPISFEHFSN